MIQLTDETSVNKNGETIDASWYLVHIDKRNLGIAKGQKQERGYASGKVFYYGSVKSALKGAIDLVIKDSGTMRDLTEMRDRIDSLEKRIEELYGGLPTMIKLLNGDKNEN